jgi:hypothetical protein
LDAVLVIAGLFDVILAMLGGGNQDGVMLRFVSAMTRGRDWEDGDPTDKRLEITNFWAQINHDLWLNILLNHDVLEVLM